MTSVHVPEETCRFVPAIDTLAVNVVWVCDESENATVIHNLTETLFYPGNRDLLPMMRENIYGPARRDDKRFVEERGRLMREATDHLVIPLHSGAEQFYWRENLLEAASQP